MCRRLAIASCLLILAGSALSQRAWEAVNAEPLWAKSVPQRAGYLRFVVVGRSNGAPIAMRDATEPSLRFLRLELARLLSMPVSDSALEPLAARVQEHKVLVQRAHWSRVLTRRLVAGNTLSEAWSLWEVPLAKLLVPAGPGPAAAPESAPVAERPAVKLDVRRNLVTKVEIEVMESEPLQFAARCHLELPSPGWKLSLDRITPRGPGGRIEVYLTGEMPARPTSTGPAEHEFRVMLVHCAASQVMLEVFLRQGPTAQYKRVGVVLLDGLPR